MDDRKTLIQRIKTQNGMLKKQNKVIGAMCEYIATLDIEEDICSKTGEKGCEQMELGLCEQCIREYFERNC